MSTEFYKKANCPTIYCGRLYRMLRELSVLQHARIYVQSSWAHYIIKISKLNGKNLTFDGENFEEER